MKESPEEKEKMELYKLFNGYRLTERELKWVWNRYREVKANA